MDQKLIMNTEKTFEIFGSSHQIVLILTILVTVCLIWQGRAHKSVRWAEYVLGVILLAIFPIRSLQQYAWGNLTLETALPMHLCDWAAICGGIALIWRNQRAAELTWFWGIAGTMNGLITPILKKDWPHFEFIGFFVLHCGIVCAAVYLAFGTELHPCRGGARRAYVAVLGYGAVAGIVNWLGKTNFGYLREKPAPGTLLDALGPWPWYAVALVGLAALLFVLLEIPFRKHVLVKSQILKRSCSHAVQGPKS